MRLRLSHLLLLPCSALAAAWVGVCVQARSAWPWAVVVHEDGRRTLLQTIFYVEHAIRELPVDLVLAAATAGAVLHFFPVRAVALRHRACWLLMLLVLCAIGIVAVVVVGPTAALENLSQVHTRSGEPLVAGAHWRYHLLSRLGLITLVFALTGLMAGSRSERAQASSFQVPLFAASLIAFGLLTLGFGLTREPFVDAVFLGHQARELFTHSVTTVPLALAACMSCVELEAPAANAPFVASDRVVVALGTLSVALGGYLAAGVIVTNAAASGQAHGLSALLFPHVFEHTLTYVLVSSTAAGLYVAMSRPRKRLNSA